MGALASWFLFCNALLYILYFIVLRIYVFCLQEQIASWNKLKASLVMNSIVVKVMEGYDLFHLCYIIHL